MISLNEQPSAPPAFLCDHCNKPVHFEDLTLLHNEASSADALRTQHVHSGCLQDFLLQQAGRWARLPKTAIDHGWFHV